MSTYTVGDGKTSAAIQTAIDLIPGNLSGHGKEWVQVYSKSGGYAEALQLWDFTNGSLSDYVIVEAMVSHNGLRGQGIVLDCGSESSEWGVDIRSNYMYFSGFCLTRSSFKASAGNHAFGLIGHHVRIYNNIIYDMKASDGYLITGWYLYPDASIVANWFINNQVIGMGTSGSTDGWGCGSYIDTPGTVGNEQVLLNNVCIDCSAQGWRTQSKDYIIVCNNYSSVDADDFSGFSSAHVVMSHNVSADTTANNWGGTGNLISKAAADQFVSVSAGSEDLHLKSTADCFRNGADMSAYFTHDCVNIPRKFWRTGAFETLPTVYSVNDGNPHKVYYSWGGNLAKVDGVDVPLRNTEGMTYNDAATIQVGQFESGLQFGGLIGDLKIFDDSDVKDTRP